MIRPAYLFITRISTRISIRSRRWLPLPLQRELLALLSGALAVAGFAPFEFWPGALLAVTILFLLWRRCHHRGSAFLLGWLWGMGLFGVGVSWLEISLHDYGGMPLALALPALFGFSAVLALFPGLVGALALGGPHTSARLRWLVLVPAWWTILEWLRSWILSGFPWLSLGYSQVPSGPLAGFAPLLGVYGVSGALVWMAGALTALLDERHGPHRRWTMVLGLVLVPALGTGLNQVSWTHPVGEPLTVNLLQGNISQDQKFVAQNSALIVNRYTQLLEHSSGRLVVMPESALPWTRQDLPESYAEELERWGHEAGGRDVLIGLFSQPEPGQFYNSVFSFGYSPSQSYQKVHLVPFGEFIPWEPLLKPLLDGILSIPLDSQQRGGTSQKPLRVAGQWVGVDICYEDAFGDGLRAVLPQATLLVNVTNDAWFGQSIGPEQHLQMAQARALETGRPLLRATNTGVSALIDAHGRLLNRAPRAEVFNLAGQVQGYAGTTPFVRFGNYGILAVCLVALVLALPISHRT